jgi:Domain of unknown function (DUF4124)
MLRALTISALSLVGTASVANADVYRWVDDHGGVHYSDQWVPGSEVIKSARPRPTEPSDTSHAQPKATVSSNRAADQIEHQHAAQAVKQDVAKAREQQCKDAKDRYAKAVQARRIYKPGKDDKSTNEDRPDDREYLSDAEADAYRLKARTEMQDACGSSASLEN